VLLGHAAGKDPIRAVLAFASRKALIHRAASASAVTCSHTCPFDVRVSLAPRRSMYELRAAIGEVFLHPLLRDGSSHCGQTPQPRIVWLMPLQWGASARASTRGLSDLKRSRARVWHFPVHICEEPGCVNHLRHERESSRVNGMLVGMRRQPSSRLIRVVRSAAGIPLMDVQYPSRRADGRYGKWQVGSATMRTRSSVGTRRPSLRAAGQTPPISALCNPPVFRSIYARARLSACCMTPIRSSPITGATLADQSSDVVHYFWPLAADRRTRADREQGQYDRRPYLYFATTNSRFHRRSPGTSIPRATCHRRSAPTGDRA